MKHQPATVSASDFRAHCLKWIEEVARTRRPLVVTKYGKAVARIVPLEPVSSVFGAMRGAGEVKGDIVKGPATLWGVEH